MQTRGVSSLLVLLALPVSILSAQSTTSNPPSDSTAKIAKLTPITVSATRTATMTFHTVTPVLSVDSSVIRHELPNGVGDLFRNLPGVDVTGVGPNQERLMIRGQRGQRILLAEDGLRMNNARRQSDFGELSSLTDINGLSGVEIVRGPASVLYGTDAIGGVVNQITLEPPRRGRSMVNGSMLYRHSSADGQDLGHLLLDGREGRFGFVASVGRREAGNYKAPAGTFGNLTFATPEVVNDVGVRDRNYSGKLSYALGEQSTIGVKVTRYESRDAGFGYVDPQALGDQSGVLVRLLYPNQVVNRVTASYAASSLPWGLADKFAFSAFSGSNKRSFDQQIDVPFGDPYPPTAGIVVHSHNYTDIGSYGARAELTKILGGRHTVVYGADWYLDHSVNTDSNLTTMTIAGPPSVTTSTVPTLPNANYATAGAFAQGEFAVASRWTLSAGARAQTIQTSTKSTPGLPAARAGVDASNGALVGNLSARFAASPRLNLVATAGRAFRAPNLIERYFDGATAEGNGYQVAAPDLAPETSLNVDLGFKYRSGRVSFEATWFNNTIHNGIRPVALDSMVGHFPAYQNQNIAKLRDHGIEALAEVRLAAGFAVLANATTLSSRNVDRVNPVGDSYGSKIGGELSWHSPDGVLQLAYSIRHQGVRKDIDLGTSPVGAELPAFTVHAARASVRLPSMGQLRPELEVAVNNLTNVLYAEASNTSFFRPEARRSLTTALRVDF